MTPVDTRSNDTKLLLGIAGLVVLGTAGIALLAGWSANEDATAGATRSVAAPSAAVHSPRPVEPVRRAALPASLELPPAPRPAPFEPAAEIAGPQADAPFVPQPGEPYVERGLESYNARDYARATGYWQAEVDARPQRAWTQYMLALSLWKAGQLDRAAAAMEGAIAVDPTSIKSLVNLARIRNDGGEYAAALEAARGALEIDPGASEAQFLAARSLFNLGRHDEAESELATCLAIDPQHGHAQNLLGLVYLRQERDLEAIVAFERAAELRPDVAFIHNNLGMALELGGERDAAIASYRTALELDATHARAASNLARLAPGVVAPDPVEPSVTVAVAARDGESDR